MRIEAFTPGAQRVLAEAHRISHGAGRARIDADALLLACFADSDLELLLRRFGTDSLELGALIHPANPLVGDPSWVRGGECAAAAAAHPERPGPDDEPEDLADRLATIGIDLAEVRRRLPRTTPPRWHLRRRRLRPLHIVLDGPAPPLIFTGQGRKVLEVALWNARRRDTLADGRDLLRGLLSDGRSPAMQALNRTRIARETCSSERGSEPTPWQVLRAILFDADSQSAR